MILCTWPRSWFYLLGLTTDFMYWFRPRSYGGSSWLWLYGSWIYNSLCNQYLSPLMLWVRISIRARCTTLCDTVCQRLATGRWFSPGPPVSSTNKTDRNDIAETLLKVAFNTIKQTSKRDLTDLVTVRIVFFEKDIASDLICRNNNICAVNS